MPALTNSSKYYFNCFWILWFYKNILNSYFFPELFHGLSPTQIDVLLLLFIFHFSTHAGCDIVMFSSTNDFICTRYTYRVLHAYQCNCIQLLSPQFKRQMYGVKLAFEFDTCISSICSESFVQLCPYHERYAAQDWIKLPIELNCPVLFDWIELNRIDLTFDWTFGSGILVGDLLLLAGLASNNNKQKATITSKKQQTTNIKQQQQARYNKQQATSNKQQVTSKQKLIYC